MLIKLRDKRIRDNRGQSTVEYIVLATAVIAVIILFAMNPNGGLQSHLGNTLNTAANGIEAKGNALDESHTSEDGDAQNSALIVNATNNLFGPG